MTIDITEIVVDLDVKVLMTLSTVANADEDYIRGPRPIIEKKRDPTMSDIHHENMMGETEK